MTAHDTELVVGFMNTIDLETGLDLLDREASYAGWCRERSLAPGDLDAARSVRDALRNAVVRRTGTVRAMTDGELRPVRLRATLTPDGVEVGGPDAPSAVIAAAARITSAGRWARVKICPGDDCGEAYYDRSRNSSRVWCDMAVCGNLAKVRANRARKHDGPGAKR
ncbi:CGNR zinc finger domain-containing protein [Leucobacter weissii]|uniref:CGNR zinc finger domain-containing protein n=1 Tax=Leucobacter weissii TaxID=1983706 RepID=A0A939ML57_9MICO|nr:CGNR zinc finger domain-containing protein [Leucobacter weissii]MBO1903003.1 CGNR zinc finger domain-containing protein [Leucobacter weissii]